MPYATIDKYQFTFNSNDVIFHILFCLLPIMQSKMIFFFVIFNRLTGLSVHVVVESILRQGHVKKSIQR